MKSEILNKIKEYKQLKRLKSYLETEYFSGSVIFCSPLFGISKLLFTSSLFNNEEQILLLLPDSRTAEEIYIELNELGLGESSILIEDVIPESVQGKLTTLLKPRKFILVSTYALLNLKLPSREENEKSTILIYPDTMTGYTELIEYLNLFNYQRESFVEAPGDFSVRGAIIDFWSYSEPNPVRLEFDGDIIESIRNFDPESQLSIEVVKSVALAASLKEKSNFNSDIFSYLTHPVVIASSSELNNIINSKRNISNDTGLTEHIEDATSIIDAENETNFVSSTKGNPKSDSLNQFDYLNNFGGVRWIVEEELASSESRIQLGFSEAPIINSNYKVLFNVLTNYAGKGFDILITSENQNQTARLKELLYESNPEVSVLIDSGQIKLETLAIKEGFLHNEEKFLLLTDYQVFNKPYRTKFFKKKKIRKSRSQSLASIRNGDYVVHETFGIGKYAGLAAIKIGDVKQESMKLLYNEGGVVYVNLNYLNLVKKYSSNENLKPTLSTLGTGEWERRKDRTKKKIKEAARELIELYAKRKATRGYRFSSDSIWQKELEASFFYEDTPDQEKVTNEVKQDMESENPMDRLVCGDVGFGKTEIAVRASFKAAQDGKQAALLVPTTILAEQHYNTFKDRLTQFPIRVAVLSRFQTKKEQSEILSDLMNGKVDIVIGTHRLLSKDVRFKDLGLLMIDEEHRFGVTAKEKIREMKVNVDTLTLTATPIPRTLNLSLLGARDLSIMATPPPNRQPIYTVVSDFEINKIREWILSEINRYGQVYFVHDRVESIVKLADYLHKHIPEVKIGIAHGQMKSSQLENVIHGFLNRKYDVLLSTKIIESGLDIPNVNTIIVNRADKFGLAELHQLRGRVGRSTRQAYAYFIVPSVSGITKKAMRRLQAIEEYTEIGSGFNLSMRDLEIRGAGNLLGKEQSGFINDVGFDLYIKLINQAVEELKYQEYKELFKSLPKQEERTEPTIDTYFEIGIPETYMPEQTDRLNFYTALYSIKKLDELDDLKEEMKDRFGSVPELVKRLLMTATLKYYASYALFDRIIMNKKFVSIILPNGEWEDYYKFKFGELTKLVITGYKDKIKFEQKNNRMKLIIKNYFNSPEELLIFLVDFSKNVIEIFKEGRD